MLDLQQLRYFVTVAETGNVGRAAGLLHISQSPLSRQLQQLEARLGLQLFARENKRLRLTPQGSAFLAEARALLAHAARVQQHAADAAQGQAGTLVLGYVAGAVHAGVLGAALRRFQRALPQARLQLRSLRSAEQFEALRRGEIDVGYTHAPAPADGALVSTHLLDEPFVLALPEGHALAGASTLELNGVPLVAPLSLLAREELRAACAGCGWAPDIRFEAADPAAALGLVEAGAGLAFVQASLARRALPGLVFRALPAGFALRMALHRVHAAAPSPLAQRWLELGGAGGGAGGDAGGIAGGNAGGNAGDTAPPAA